MKIACVVFLLVLLSCSEKRQTSILTITFKKCPLAQFNSPLKIYMDSNLVFQSARFPFHEKKSYEILLNDGLHTISITDTYGRVKKQFDLILAQFFKPQEVIIFPCFFIRDHKISYEISFSKL